MTKLPAKPSTSTALDEQRMIDRVSEWVAVVRHKLETSEDEVRDWLEAQLRDRLHRGLTDRQKVIVAAENGCAISHKVLMEEFHEALDVDAMPPASLRAYAAKPDRPKQKRGPHWWRDWQRNVGICILIDLARRQFGLLPTRNRTIRRAGHPSGASLVTAALARHQFHVGEATLNNLVHGIYGELVQALNDQFFHELSARTRN